MRVRFALTLLGALAVLTAGPASAQQPAPAPGADAVSIRIAHPRAAVLTVYESGVESFLLVGPTSRDQPLLPQVGSQVRLRADYEAVFMPLTAGWTRFRLEAWRLVDGERELLDDDQATVVDFGPSRHGGQLTLRLKLKPGLHQVALVAITQARAVGVPDWTTDRDEVIVWILIPGRGAEPPLSATLPQPVVSGSPQIAAVSPSPIAGVLQQPGMPGQPQPGVDPTLPLGGLYVGGQRGVTSPESGGAVNFETGQNRTILVRVGEKVRVWTDYELWWTEEAQGEAGVQLTIRQRISAEEPGTVPPLAEDHFATDGDGPQLEDGHLVASFSFEKPGKYQLVATLGTRVRSSSGRVYEDEDRVPFQVHVVGVQPTGGAIAGRVTAEDGTALEGVRVEATDKRGNPVGQADTNADGRYLIEKLKEGTYFVHAVPEDLNYLDEWWPDSPSIRGAEKVKVEDGQVTDGIDFALTPGGTITGRVTNAEGEPLGGIQIAVGYLRSDTTPVAGNPNDPEVRYPVVARTKTNDDGRYSIDQLRPNAYWVRASDPEGHYWTEYYDDKPDFAHADKVWVEAGKVTEGIDFELTAGGAITGNVRAQADGETIALPGIVVQARDPEDPEQVIKSTVTNRQGHYRLGGLHEGRYLVRASDPRGRYLPEWYEEASTPEEATPVPVEEGQTTDGINFTLERAPTQTVVFIHPEHTGATVGGSGKLQVRVAGVENLGAFEAEIAWNPEILSVDGVELGEFLGSTGREVIPMEPVIDNDTGRLRFGAASVGNERGPSGGGVLFVIAFSAQEVGETGVEIELSVLTHPNAEPIEHQLRHGKVTVGECMFGDFDCNCKIDIRDVMEVVKRWGTREGDPDYDPTFDLDEDGDIDIVDVQIEASLWGRRCDQPTPVPGEPVGPAASDSELAGSDTGNADTPLGASLTLTAEPSVADVGQEITVVVNITDAVDLAGFDLWMSYDPARLRFIDAELGPFMSSTGRAVFPLGPTVEDGLVGLGAFSLPGAPAPSGQGQLAALTFQVLAPGTSTLAIAEAVTTDSLGGSRSASGGSTTVEGRGGTTELQQAYLPFTTAGK